MELQVVVQAASSPFLALIAIAGYSPPPVPTKKVVPDPGDAPPEKLPTPAPASGTKPKPASEAKPKPAKPKVVPFKDEYLRSLLGRGFYLLSPNDAIPVRDDYLWREDLRGRLMSEAVGLHKQDTTKRGFIPKELVKMCKLANEYVDCLFEGRHP